MRRPLLVGVLVLGGLVAGVLTEQATAAGFSERIELVGGDVSRCTGELFQFEGTLHIAGNAIQDASGGFHAAFEANLNVRATTETGASYVVQRQFTHASYFREDEPMSVFTETTREHFVRQGESVPDDDYWLQILFHITVTPSGEVAAEFVRFDEHCDGEPVPA